MIFIQEKLKLSIDKFLKVYYIIRVRRKKEMTISELIDCLEMAKKVYGDITVKRQLEDDFSNCYGLDNLICDYDEEDNVFVV